MEENDEIFMKFLNKKITHDGSRFKTEGTNTTISEINQRKVCDLVTKFRSRIYPKLDRQRMKFEKNFTVFQDMSTFLPVQDYIKHMSENKLQQMQQEWKKIQVNQVFKHYNTEMDVLLSRKDNNETDQLMNDLNLLKTAYSRIQSNKQFQVKKNLMADQLVKHLESLQQGSSKNYDSTDINYDLFYDQVDTQFQAEQKPSEINLSHINNVKTFLTNLGVNQSEQAQHLERIIESPVHRKSIREPIIRLNFQDKSQKILKILKKATQRIYKKNLVDQIEEERKQKLEMKDIRNQIINKKKQRILRFESRLETLDMEEIDMQSIKYRMSPEVRSAMVKSYLPMEFSTNPRRSCQKIVSSRNIQRKAMIAVNLQELMKVKRGGTQDIFPGYGSSQTISNQASMKNSYFMGQQKSQLSKLTSNNQSSFPLLLVQTNDSIVESQKKQESDKKQEQLKKHIKNRTELNFHILLDNTQSEKPNQTITLGQSRSKPEFNFSVLDQLPNHTNLAQQRSKLSVLMTDIECLYDVNKMEKSTYKDVIDKMENNKQRVMDKILKGDQLESLKYLTKQPNQPGKRFQLKKKSNGLFL